MNRRRVGLRHVGFSHEPLDPFWRLRDFAGGSRSPLHAFFWEKVTRNGSREFSPSPVRVV
jgi:hypothetical protein